MTPSATARRYSILLVDADGHRGRTLASGLEALGCSVAVLATGGAALRYVVDHEPDAVIADWNLPDMEGPEFARQVTLGCLPSRVVLRKDEVEWRLLRQALECGAEEVLPSSVSADHLLRVLGRKGLSPRVRAS